jgi:hypothetical protein
MNSGLLIDGKRVLVSGVNIIGPHDAAWSHLDPGDCKPRLIRPVQLILHKTIADDPELVLEGAGPFEDARLTAEYWQKDSKHSGAHLVTGDDGTVACLADLVRVEAYHATVSNLYSIGFETREKPGGGVYQAALDATVRVTLAICEHLGIQLQVPRDYNGHPLKRMLNGGRDMIGVFGHRDNTEDRGRWDPGDLLFDMLRASGAESFDFDGGEDIATWRSRQRMLNARGHHLVEDGLPGPATTAALKLDGYRGGLFALGRA